MIYFIYSKKKENLKMKINDKKKTGVYFNELKKGDIFGCCNDGNETEPYYYCIKTEPYYKDGEVDYNAVDLETGDLLYIGADEKIIITIAELTVK